MRCAQCARRGCFYIGPTFVLRIVLNSPFNFTFNSPF